MAAFRGNPNDEVTSKVADSFSLKGTRLSVMDLSHQAQEEVTDLESLKRHRIPVKYLV